MTEYPDSDQIPSLHREIAQWLLRGEGIEAINLDLDRTGLASCDDATLDYAFLGDVLQRLANPLRALAEAFRVIRPGGKVVIAAHDRHYCHGRRLPRPSLLALLQAWTENQSEVSDPDYRAYLQAVDPPVFWNGPEAIAAAVAKARQQQAPVRAWKIEAFRPFLGDAFASIGIHANCCFESCGQSDEEYLCVWEKIDGKTGINLCSDDMQHVLEHAEARLRRQEDDIRSLQNDCLRLNLELERQQATVAALLASTSWRITRPLRGMMHTWRRLFSLRSPAADAAAVTVSLSQEWRLNTKAYEAGPVPRTSGVDLIVCVHNALLDVQRCLSSIVRHTLPPYRLILVDDGSDEPTRNYLSDFAQSQNACLIRNERARGYTRAANQGLRTATAEYVVLLNSDTMVTPDWLDRLVKCAAADGAIGMVGPLSNTASWQSVPELEVDGDWASNPLPDGTSAADMAARIARRSARLYPRLPFLNGFCLLIRMALIESIGHFDEETFGQGYGEENDYCLRARAAGWQLALADDTYIFHAQSKSYTHERRKALCDAAGQALIAKHGAAPIEQGVAFCRDDRVLRGLRQRARLLNERDDCLARGRQLWEGRSVLFVLPIAQAAGGANIVIAEARAMIAMGVDARILNMERMQAIFDVNYPNLDVPVLYVEAESQVAAVARRFDAVIATVNFTVEWLRPLAEHPEETVIGYYIQDFEPWFYAPDSTDYRSALASYTAIAAMRCFTKTEWNRDTVLEQTGIRCATVGPSYEIDLFMPRRRQVDRGNDQRVRICAMVRPETARRAPSLTMRVLRSIQHRFSQQVEIIIFGVWPDNPDFLDLPHDFAFACVGELTPAQMAALLNEMDIFADFSPHQAMGLTAMEAMSCGVAVIVPRHGGAQSFARHEENALLIDTTREETCRQALERLTLDAELRTRLQQRALTDITRFFPEQAAARILDVLFKDGVR